VGVDGVLSLDGNASLAPKAVIKTSTDGQISIPAPAVNPCAVVIQNNRQSDLLLQVSGANVAAQLVKFNAQAGMNMQTSQPLQAFTTFLVEPSDDVMVMYVGSVNPAANGSLIFAW